MKKFLGKCKKLEAMEKARAALLVDLQREAPAAFRECRTRLKMTQPMFCVASGVGNSYLSRVEMGRKRPGTDTLLALLHVAEKGGLA